MVASEFFGTTHLRLIYEFVQKNVTTSRLAELEVVGTPKEISFDDSNLIDQIKIETDKLGAIPFKCTLIYLRKNELLLTVGEVERRFSLV